VLRLIADAVRGARPLDRRVAVCGAIASDPGAVPILIGIGVDELSVSLPAIPAVKAQIRSLRLDECQRLAERALAAESAQEVRALVPDSLARPTPGQVESRQ
jgi:phosphocarrier protein FPr